MWAQISTAIFKNTNFKHFGFNIGFADAHDSLTLIIDFATLKHLAPHDGKF